MSRWLLNTFSTPVLALVVVGGVTMLAVALVQGMRRLFPSIAAGDHNEFTGYFLGVLGGVYGIVLAFVIVALWADYKEAEAVVSREASDLAMILRDGEALPPPIKTGLDLSVGDYVHAVVDREWKLMRTAGEDERAWAAVDRMFVAMRAAEPVTNMERAFYTETLVKLNDVVSARRARLHQAQRELPAALEFLIAAGALLVILFLSAFGMPSLRAHTLLVAGVAGLLSFSLLLAVMLNHPFSGDVSISTEDYRTGALARLWP